MPETTGKRVPETTGKKLPETTGKKVPETTEKKSETESIEEQKKEFTRPLIVASVVSSLGFFQYGYNFWVLHFPSVVLLNFYNVTEEHKRDEGIHQSILLLLMVVAIALYPLGGLVGCLLFASLADMWGRLKTMIVNNFLSIACAVLMAFSKMIKAYEFSMFSRFITGICSGIFSGVVPVYLIEIAPKKWRGAISMVSSFFLALGTMVGQVFTAPQLLGNEKGWPILMSLAGFVALFQMIPLLYIPESPRYLLIQGRDEMNARQVLQKLKGQDDVEEEIEDLRLEDNVEKAEKNMTVFRLVHFPGLQRRFMIILVLNFAQQFAGYSAVYYYVDGIYMSMGLGKEMFYNIHIVTFTSLLLITFASMHLIDSLGRRTLLLAGFGVCSICSALLSMTIQLQKTHFWLSYINTMLIIIFLLGHFLGPGSIPHLLVSELFLQSSRCSAFAVSGAIFWLCRFIATLTLGGIEAALRAYAFLLYLPVGIVTFFFVFKFVPETKTKTFREIRRLMAAQATKKAVVK